MKKRTVLEIDPEVFRRGSLGRPAVPMRLAAGPLQLLYEPQTGFVRRVCLGQNEVLRGIYAAVRDENWRTIPPQLQEIKNEVHEDHFSLEFHCVHRAAPIDFQWQGRIEGRPDGTIIYTLDGQAHSTFRKNRIGFCVLHPIRECAGARARQVRTSGEVIESRFPQLVEPQIFGQSSFRDLQALAHEVKPGLWAELTFAGDVFEMEDQRNWTDASFKTYCTPLALPFPVLIQAGTEVHQRIELRLKGAVEGIRPALPPSGCPETVLKLAGEDAAWRLLPPLGLGLATHNEPLREQEVQWLRALPLAHVRCDLHVGQPDWQRQWRRAVRQAARLKLPLELALHLPSDLDATPASLTPVMAASGARVKRVLALREGEAATSEATLKKVRQLLGRRAGSVPVGAGTNAHFCELNREQALGKVPWQQADFLFWPMTPQVHAFDDLSLIETLEVQGDTVAAAAAFAPGKPCVVSPITLKPRFNAVATCEEEGEAGEGKEAGKLNDLPPNVDRRQCSLLAAGWTLGSLAALSAAGVSSITYYETTGWRGVMETMSGFPGGRDFYSIEGGVFPVYFLFAAFKGFKEATVPFMSPSGGVTALALRGQQGRRRLLLAHVQGDARRVQLHLPPGCWKVHALDAWHYMRCLREPEMFFRRAQAVCDVRQGRLDLTLGPYMLAVLEEVAEVSDWPVKEMGCRELRLVSRAGFGW